MRFTMLLALLSLTALPVFAQGQDSTKKIKPRPDVLSLEEIDKVRSEFANAYDLVRRLRPQFLRARGASSFGNSASGKNTPYAKIVVDGIPRGDLSVLRQIPIMQVREIRYLSAGDASTRYGTGFDGVAIEISTR